jgi:hypothetical protein
MGEEKGIKVIEKKIKEPVPMKEQKEFFVSFMEVELEADEILNLAFLMFKYMPSHVEILSPQNLVLSNAGFNDLLNELTRRLHEYEEITRMLQAEKMILENQLKTIVGVEKKEEKEVKEKVKKPRKDKRQKPLAKSSNDNLKKNE